MSKEIKDYLHLYIGCEVMTPRGIETLVSVGLLGSYEQKWRTLGEFQSFTKEWHQDNKLCLRDLSDMTEEEREELWHMQPGPVEIRGEITTYLLSKGFDLFGLIPAKLAINAKELNNEKGN